MKIHSVFLIFTLFILFYKKIEAVPIVQDTFSVKVTCDDTYELYLNGYLLGSGNSWKNTYSYNTQLSISNNIFGIKCKKDEYRSGGFIGVFGNVVTSSDNWKCKENTVNFPNNWNSYDFDDSSWLYATNYGRNDGMTFWKSTTGQERSGIPNNAEWLWGNNPEDEIIYCRYKIPNKIPLKVNNSVISNSKNVSILVKKSNFVKSDNEDGLLSEINFTPIENLINYHNETNVKFRELERQLTKVLKEAEKKQLEEVKINKNNYISANLTLKKVLVKESKIKLKIKILHESIIELNRSLTLHYKQMFDETKYLNKLTLLKPKFIGTVSKVNEKLALVKNYITDTIVEGIDKQYMLNLLLNLQNTTKYATSDLSRAFLEHYEKYKNQIKSNDVVYEQELHELQEYMKTYTIYKREETTVLNEYKRVISIINKLKAAYKLSLDDADLFNELVFRILSLIKNKNCKADTYISPEFDKNCATTLLQSHVKNNLI
jgi:hypothetical protein